MATQNPTAMDVICAAVKGILAEGCSITVEDEEDVRLERNRDEAEIMHSFGQSDVEYIVVISRTGDSMGEIVLAPFGDAVDVLTDYYGPLEPLLTDAFALIGLN